MKTLRSLEDRLADQRGEQYVTDLKRAIHAGTYVSSRDLSRFPIDRIAVRILADPENHWEQYLTIKRAHYGLPNTATYEEVGAARDEELIAAYPQTLRRNRQRRAEILDLLLD